MSDYKELDSIPDLGKFVDWVWEMKAERDHLRAELAGLRTGFDAQDQVIAGLKTDKEALTYNLKIAHSVINSVHPDQERMDWIDENYTGHGGGTEFNLRLHLPCDIDDGGLRHAIDAAMGKGGEA